MKKLDLIIISIYATFVILLLVLLKLDSERYDIYFTLLFVISAVLTIVLLPTWIKVKKYFLAVSFGLLGLLFMVIAYIYFVNIVIQK